MEKSHEFFSSSCGVTVGMMSLLSIPAPVGVLTGIVVLVTSERGVVGTGDIIGVGCVFVLSKVVPGSFVVFFVSAGRVGGVFCSTAALPGLILGFSTRRGGVVAVGTGVAWTTAPVLRHTKSSLSPDTPIMPILISRPSYERVLSRRVQKGVGEYPG